MKRVIRFLSELKRRRVYRVATAYAVTSFAVLEAADLVLPAIPLPSWTYRALVLLCLAGMPVALVLSWVFDITPQGIRREGGLSYGEVPAGSDAGAKGRPLLLGTLIVGLVGAAAWVAGRESVSMPEPRASSTLAVLPFSPATQDSSLDRLGRELAITVSSSLAGATGMATAEPLAVLANVDPGGETLSLDQAREVALSLGASRFTQGAILGEQGNLRLEIGLYETRDGRRVGSRTVSAREMDALTDSATLAVLQMIWEEVPSGPPNPGAISTGSLEALAAYLAGESAIAEGRWREAPEFFSRAISADSTFWFAYWRLEYALSYYGSPVDSVVRARAWEHRDLLPTRDRLLIEATSTTGSERLEILQEATTRFPSYWPAWWDLGELLVHHGGYLGHTLTESRSVLERTLSLNPHLVSAWSHLLWTVTKLRDTEAMKEVIAELSDARYDQVSLQEAGLNSLPYYRALLELAQAGEEVPSDVIETGVRELTSYRGPREPASTSMGLLTMGFPQAQVLLSRGVLESDAASEPMARAQYLVLAHSWANLGAWDSALVAADAYASSGTEAEALLVPYQIAAAGSWLGTVDTRDARERRPAQPRLEAAGRDLAGEAAWLDGLVGLAATNPGEVAAARDALAKDTTGNWNDLLDRSLAAFQAALAGDSARGGLELADLERWIAEEGLLDGVGGVHPFLNGIDRLAGARWLLASGDTLTARALLPWYEGVLSEGLYRLDLANHALAPTAMGLRRSLKADGEAEGHLLQRDRPDRAPARPDGSRREH